MRVKGGRKVEGGREGGRVCLRERECEYKCECMNVCVCVCVCVCVW